MRNAFGNPRVANVVALAALFVALGGTSYAALTITGRNVKNSSLTGVDVKNESLTGTDVKRGSLLASDFKPGQLPPGAKGDKGDRGDPGAPGPSTAYRSAYPYTPPGSAVPNSPKAILNAVTVPPGTYAIFGDALVQNTGASAENVVCELVAELPSSTAGGSPRTRFVTTVPAGGQVQLAGSLTATRPNDGALRLECFAETITSTGLHRIASNLTAIKVGEIVTQ